MLSIIVACDINGGIGKDNNLLFKIKEDLKRFKELTTEHTIIMGRKTYDSLPNGALPNRHNIVITTSNRINTMSPKESLIFKNNINELIEEYKNSSEEVFIIGGGLIYEQFLPYCNKIYLTTVKGNYDADTFFKINSNEWRKEWESGILESDGYSYNFINLTRKDLI
ncbi:dihydrofolate reductase [Clostridium beijerinckii]|uniref:dihydrofolate reductase n=1 Tax=Clostridium beijerinckii TaxID=1520 RepID=UPI00156EA0F4|nr:dihydrofolate reductase [Clostridium beijerinckii]NRU52604.1 dihydrofolate reductase [Clostridium beijerinckii]NYC68647.1 dihydrofolate reductase [Clostridium beijerinckii]NYC91796.1 dihydrofolate reductase [Clostridium beijerinckii]